MNGISRGGGHNHFTSIEPNYNKELTLFHRVTGMHKLGNKVSVIIPNYNGKEHLKRLLPTIANQTFDDYEVIIIDDFSPDRSALEYISTFIENQRNMQLIENERNLGFVKTCNKGFRLASGDYVCLLTNDTDVASNFIERNVQIMEDDCSIGVLSSIVVDQYGDNWFCGGRFESGLTFNLKDDFHGLRYVDWVAGTACFYRKQVFDNVGFLNEDFVMYHEDVDFCLRLRSQTNYNVCMFSEKLVTHYLPTKESLQLDATKRDRMGYYLYRNHILLLRRHSRRYIPKLLLQNLKDVINYLIASVLKNNSISFSDSIHMIFYILKGTFSGLLMKQTK